MIRPFDIPEQFTRFWTNDHVPESRHPEAGWYAHNSISPCDCLPSYRLAGGGVLAYQLTDLPKAIEQSIGNLKARKAECERMIESLESFHVAVHDGQK